jgi:hypothetical protein
MLRWKLSLKNRHEWRHLYLVNWYYDVIIKSVSGRLWHELLVIDNVRLLHNLSITNICMTDCLVMKKGYSSMRSKRFNVEHCLNTGPSRMTYFLPHAYTRPAWSPGKFGRTENIFITWFTLHYRYSFQMSKEQNGWTRFVYIFRLEYQFFPRNNYTKYQYYALQAWIQPDPIGEGECT